MGDPLPPDPYHALGVAKDATAAAIKTQYRKLVLKCHPDKVKDEAAKQEASDNFHKIQSAWEIIGDEARRARYDAQVKLQELRRDVFHGHGDSRRSSGGDVRTASYRMPTESARGGYFDARGPDRYGPKVSPQYEERRPSGYASDDYYEEPSRPTARKYDDYERTPKRAPPREEREKPRAKENERSSRKEKSRRTDKDVRRDRANKQAYVEVQEEYVSDEYPQRTPPEDEHLRRAREDFFAASDPYVRESPAAYDERTRKTFENLEQARAHMERSKGANRPRGESAPRDPSPQEPPPRPEPVRMGSSKDKVERMKREARPSLFGGVRHGSGERPKSSRTKTDKEQKSSDEDRRNSRRKEETRESSRKTPTLKQTQSSPPEVRPERPGYGRQRSYTIEEQHTEEPIPQMKRSETMPSSPTNGPPPSRDSKRHNISRLHPETATYPTPDPTPEPEPMKYPYGKNQIYADDDDFIPTPDGFKAANAEPFRTQEYVPSRETGRQSTREATRSARYTHSPEPMKETERERSGRRSSSARHTTQKPSMPRTTSTQYVVEPEGVRPAPSRENSGRDSLRGLSRENSGGVRPLYGEIRTNGGRSGSPRANYIVPPPDDVAYAPRYKESDFKVQTGYTRARDPEKPSFSRNGSGLAREARRAVYAS